MSLIRLGASMLTRGDTRARLSVLMFHRVKPFVDPLFPGEIDACRFDAILDWVSRWFNVIPLGEAVEAVRECRLQERAMVLTFDDGYADNYEVALPILLRRELSATFFVATGFVDGGTMWNDRVIEAVRRLSCRVLNLERVGLGCFDVGSIENRRATIERLLGLLKHRPYEERRQLVDEIASMSPGGAPDDLMMTSEQLRAMRAAGMTLGAHTCSHPILAVLDEAEAQREIVEGKRQLESIIDASVDHFAYPNGKAGADYLPVHVSMAKDAGYMSAVTTESGAAANGDDLYQIPRFTPWDRTRTRFGLRLMMNLVNAHRQGVR